MALTVEGVIRRIATAVDVPRRRRQRPVAEDTLQCRDGIGNIDPTIVIAIVGIGTTGLAALKDDLQQGDSIGQVEQSILIGIAPQERLWHLDQC